MDDRGTVLLLWLMFTIGWGISGLFNYEFYAYLRPAWHVSAILMVVGMYASGGKKS